MKKNKLCLHLFIKNKLWGGLVFGVKEDRSLQAKLWDEYDDCVLPHKQNESFFVQDASALEEQLEQDHLYLKSDSCSTITQAKRFMGFQIDMMPILTNSVKIITVWDSEVFFFFFLQPKQVHRNQTSVSVWVYLCVEGHRCPLGILRHFMSVVEVVGQGWLLMFVHQIWVGAVCSYGHSQQAMYHNICIPV